VSFRSSNPKRAAEIANAVANSVVGLELGVDAEASQKANAWSQGRLTELRIQMENAQRALAEFKGANTVASQFLLRDLVARVQTLRSANDTFLRKDTTQRDLFPVAKPRVVAAATEPLESDKPNIAIMFAVVTLIGASAGFGIGAWRDARDRTFRTRDQVKSLLGVDCIALAPKLRRRNKLRQGYYGRGSKKLFSGNHQFIEALRSIELATETARGLKGANTIIGITSALPGEGKSTIAAALAFHLRQRMERVLLVDCDMRNPHLSQVLSPKAGSGLSELTQGTVARDDAILNGDQENINFLPARSRVNGCNVPVLVDSYNMRDAFASLRRQYDIIFLDLPPLAPVIDAKAIADLIDGYLLIVEWGQTKIEVVQHALDGAIPLNDKLIGIVLNKVNLSRLSRYDPHLMKYYSPDYFRPRRGLW
jgi:capsular exopolysaccharide synthesis family protein